MKRILQVLLPILQEKAVFDYHSSEDLELGTIVQVSLRNKELEGIVWSKTRSDDKVPASKIKDIIRSFPNIALPPQSLKFMKFVSEYNLISLGAVLKLFFPFPNLNFLTTSLSSLPHPSSRRRPGPSPTKIPPIGWHPIKEDPYGESLVVLGPGLRRDDGGGGAHFTNIK